MKLRYLSVSSEQAPWSRSGGLAEVTGSLPSALDDLWSAQGLEVEVWSVSPLYPSVWREAARRGITLNEGPLISLDPLEYQSARVWYLTSAHSSTLTLWIDLPEAFDRAAPYGPKGGAYEDNPLRFAALSLATLRLPEALTTWLSEVQGLSDEDPAQRSISREIDHHLLHCHDWQTSFAPIFLKLGWSSTHFKTIFTIHNLRHQGLAPAEWVPRLGLSWDDFHLDYLEHWGQLNPLKDALRDVDRVTTVSPQYAEEIFEPEFGCELDEYLNAHQVEVIGVVNGLDLSAWDPHTSSALVEHLPLSPTDEAIDLWKAWHRQRVSPRLFKAQEDLTPVQRGPWGVMISRFDGQKGVELVLALASELIMSGVKLCILGSGDPQLEREVRRLGERFPDSVDVHIGFDVELAHQLFAAADFSLIPSRFEPCGLTQMQSMRYGVIPLATRVGGLVDTIEDIRIDMDDTSASVNATSGDGFLADHPTAPALAEALRRLLRVWSAPQVWRATRRRALDRDFSWNKSAQDWSRVMMSLLE